MANNITAERQSEKVKVQAKAPALQPSIPISSSQLASVIREASNHGRIRPDQNNSVVLRNFVVNSLNSGNYELVDLVCMIDRKMVKETITTGLRKFAAFGYDNGEYYVNTLIDGHLMYLRNHKELAEEIYVQISLEKDLGARQEAEASDGKRAELQKVLERLKDFVLSDKPRKLGSEKPEKQ